MEELEIEFKNLIDYHTFEHLRNTLFEDAELKTQTNFYIDTINFDLKARKCALRIRDNGDQKAMTLKIPQTIGIMEYTDTIDEHILDEEYIEQKSIPDVINKQLDNMQILHNTLRIFGALSTERREIDYHGGTLVLDASFYLDTSDYELEYEVTDYETGQKHFDAFLEHYNIEQKDTLSKVQRFYDHYRKLTSK